MMSQKLLRLVAGDNRAGPREIAAERNRVPIHDAYLIFRPCTAWWLVVFSMTQSVLVLQVI